MTDTTFSLPNDEMHVVTAASACVALKSLYAFMYLENPEGYGKGEMEIE